MLNLLLATSLQLIALTVAPPHAKEEEPARVEEEAAKPSARTAAKHGTAKAAEATEETPAVPKRAKKPAPKAAPAPAAAPVQDRMALALDVRAAKLENENARLRQQLALAGGSPPAAVIDSATALQELAAGNLRFVSGTRVRTLLSTQDPELRERLATSQAPFAVIITCSDSRLADNLIFDQELGRLFTIREAGNSPDTQSLASVEYALEHLGSKIVVVMGHVGCGAVKAVEEANGKPLPGNLWSLQAAMSGLLETTPQQPAELDSTYLRRLVERNAQRQAQAVLSRSELVRELVVKGKVKVVPAVYDLASGKVAWLDAVRTAPLEAAHP